ncbi:hypothetical protein [Kitasatospora sp. CB01950]|uniref:hypothetical protein n=1 Tax=Kitasatospora sp. CB01950 TaxID=1703930 RepID=UPI000939DFBC|nr:hypothetical protein [Kitasatospora sp. CB01950]
MTASRHLTAHHAWAWYAEAELPLLPDHTPALSTDPQPAAPAWPCPPPPAPAEDQLLALVADAAARARAHLLIGAPLACARDDDAVRLAAAVPRARLADIAERLDIDIAELRERARR